MIKIGLCGFGKMGNLIKTHLINALEKYEYVGKFTNKDSILVLEELCKKSDIIIDFSNHNSLKNLLEYSNKFSVKLVIGTTGFSNQEHDLIKQFSINNTIFYSPNMSLGVCVFTDIAAKFANVLGDKFDIAITDLHHKYKQDAPSGTALMMADAIKNYKTNKDNHNHPSSPRNIQISSIRIGESFGKHEVVFASKDEIITLTHQVFNRDIFAKGTIKAAEWLYDQKPGLYSMNDIIKNEQI